MMTLRVYSVKDIMMAYQKFYDNVFNGGSIEAGRMFLYKLKNFVTEYYISRGKDPSEIKEKIEKMVATLNMDISGRGKRMYLEEQVLAFNQELKKISIEDPIASVSEMVDEFNEVWREFVNKPTSENASAVQCVIKSMEMMKPHIERYARGKDESIYDKYVMMVKEAGQIRGAIHAVESSGSVPKKVEDKVGDFFDKANEFTAHVGDLVTEKVLEEEKAKKEEEKLEDMVEDLPPEAREAIVKGNTVPVSEDEIEDL